MSVGPGVSVQVPRARVVLGLLVVLVLFTGSLPAATALHGNAQPSVQLCGVVENAAGWPLEGVRVTAIGRGMTNTDHLPSPSDLTDADGRFQILILADFYRLVFEETKSSAARGGASYQPYVGDVAGHSYKKGVCEADKNGIEFAPVTLVAPGVGFLAASVQDAIDGASLAGATVSTKVLGFHTWGQATTGDDGIAYLTCPLHVPTTIGAELAAYDGAQEDLSCDALEAAATLTTWRSAVDVNGTITDNETGEPVADASVAAVSTSTPLPEDHPYVLTASSRGDGGYLLGLPWGETFDVTIEKGAYGAQGLSVAPIADDLMSGISGQDVVLVRQNKVFQGTVTDVLGTPIPAELGFIGPLPADTTHPVSTADGLVTVTLPVGKYNVAISSPGKNSRACELTLVHEAEDIFDSACLMLVAYGKGAVRGIVRDGLTMLPLGNISVNSGDGPSTATGPDGGFVLELEPGTHAITASEPFFADATVTPEVALDAVVDVGDVALTRDTVAFTVAVQDGTGPIEGATVCPTYEPIDGTPVAHACATSDASGAAHFDLQWTARDGGYDTGDYTFTAERFTSVPFYNTTDCLIAIDIDIGQSDDHSADCSPARIPAVETVVGPLIDAHTNQPIAGAAVSTELPGGVDCSPDYTCASLTDGTGTATLWLPQGFEFSISAAHVDYRGGTAASVSSGNATLIDEQLYRVSHLVTIDLLDAHTDLPLESAQVSADFGSYVCDPDGSYVCAATTDASGTAVLDIPWGHHGFIVADGAFDVVRDASFGDIEGDVNFFGTSFAAQTVNAPVSLDARLARQPGAPLVVDIRSFDGDPVTGATLSVQSERFGSFDCAPTESAGTYDGLCDTALDASTGTVSLALPHGTADDHTWWLTSEAAGHFREEATGVANDVSLSLWPLEFDLVVDPVDLMEGETVPLVVVCVTNLDESGAGLTTPPPREVCQSSGVDPVKLVFEGTTWRRTGPADDTDRFLVRAAGTLHFPAMVVRAAGPAAADVSVPMVPANPEAPEDRTGLISGRVVDVDATLGDGGVFGAHVVVTSTDGCPVPGFEGATGPDGAFLVPVACHGSFQVDVVDARYEESASQSTIVPNGAPLHFDLERVVRTASVTVLDANGGAPVEGATVQFTGLDTSATAPAVTDASGRAAVLLPWGAYAVAVAAPEGQWLVSSGETTLILSHLEDAETTVVLTSAPAVPSGCAPGDASPDVCGPVDSDPAVRLVSVVAAGLTGTANGNWVLVPPRMGASPLLGVGEKAEPFGYTGPHDGTWTIVYAPSLAGIGGMPSFPVTVTLSYESGGAVRTLEATLEQAIVGPSPFVSPVLSWQVNLHSHESLACASPHASCDAEAGFAPDAAARARVFLP